MVYLKNGSVLRGTATISGEKVTVVDLAGNSWQVSISEVERIGKEPVVVHKPFEPNPACPFPAGVLVKKREKSYLISFALSFFLGMGGGNWYTNAWTSGALVAAGYILGIGLMFGGALSAASSGSSGMSYLTAGAVIFVSSWVSDWTLALVNTGRYNNRIKKEIYEKCGLTPPAR